MSYWLLVPLLGFVSLLQGTLIPLLTVGGFKVDFPLLVVIAWGLISAPREAAIWGFICGLFLDLFSGLPFGTQTLALTAVGLAMGLAQSTIFRSNLLLPPTAAIVATLGYNIIVLSILSLLNWQIPWSDYMLRVTLPTAILNTVALPLAYLPLQRLHQRYYPKIEW